MSNEEAIQIHVLKVLNNCPPLTDEMQARITWEMLDAKHPNVIEARKRVAALLKDRENLCRQT